MKPSKKVYNELMVNKIMPFCDCYLSGMSVGTMHPVETHSNGLCMNCNYHPMHKEVTETDIARYIKAYKKMEESNDK